MVDHSVGKDLPSIFVESFEYFPGRGLTATVNGVEVRHSYVRDYLYVSIFLLVLIVYVMCVHFWNSLSPHFYGFVTVSS